VAGKPYIEILYGTDTIMLTPFLLDLCCFVIQRFAWDFTNITHTILSITSLGYGNLQRYGAEPRVCITKKWRSTSWLFHIPDLGLEKRTLRFRFVKCFIVTRVQWTMKKRGPHEANYANSTDNLHSLKLSIEIPTSKYLNSDTNGSVSISIQHS
jgi:hypothetical protein